MCCAGGTVLAQEQERMTQSGTLSQRSLMDWDGGGRNRGKRGRTVRILAATFRFFFPEKSEIKVK
jgi:hypothetical protein